MTPEEMMLEEEQGQMGMSPLPTPMAPPSPGGPLPPGQDPNHEDGKDLPVDEPLEITEDLQKVLLDVVKLLTRDDDEVRRRMVPIWELYEYYWRGIQDVLYDSDTNSVVSASDVTRKVGAFEDAYISQKIINIYRAHGESIAAALAQGDPQIRFFPEDAERPQDITTARAYSAAAEYISDDNDLKLLDLQAIYIRWNQPFVTYYNTYVYDEKFGSIVKRTFSSMDVEMSHTICPACSMDLTPPTEQGSVQGMNAPGMPPPVCEMCGEEGIQDTTTEKVPVVSSEEMIPKGRETIEVYGPRHVRVPYNIKKLEQAGYLILETEHHWAQIVEAFPQLQEDLKGGYGGPAGSSFEQESRYRRTAAEARDYVREQRTLSRCWLRPWAFRLAKDEEDAAKLRALFPHGVQVTYVDDKFCEAYDESMDDHWTFVPDPFAEHIHGDPLGKVIVPIQDMRNDVAQLTLETILFGIAETFADPEVLNFKEYNETEKAPGNTYQAVRPQGMGLDAGFFQPKSATLSDNVEVFRQSLDQDAQFVSKDFPGIFGGPLQKGSSRTAEEYSMAKQSALQSLSTIWKVIVTARAEVMRKATDELRRNMVYQGEDLKYVKESGSGFKNIWVRLSDITEGKIGRVRAESSESFPVTWEQQWARITELLNIPVPQIQQFLLSPENMGEFSRAMGLRRFKFPGEEDRDKQLWEIHEMLQGMPVEVDPMVDDHSMHTFIIQSWAKSPEGLEAKQTNPQGYGLVMQHLQFHQMIMMQQQQQQMAMASQNGIQPEATKNSLDRKVNG